MSNHTMIYVIWVPGRDVRIVTDLDIAYTHYPPLQGLGMNQRKEIQASLEKCGCYTDVYFTIETAIIDQLFKGSH